MPAVVGGKAGGRQSARRRLGVAVAAAAAAPTAGEDPKQPPQQAPVHCIGASVYSLGHKSTDEDHGYGCIRRHGTPASDGTRTWFVEWERPGARQRAFKETSLEVALIPHSSRISPSGLQQPVLVVLGQHKGKRGTTVAQVRTSLRRDSGEAGSARSAAIARSAHAQPPMHAALLSHFPCHCLTPHHPCLPPPTFVCSVAGDTPARWRARRSGCTCPLTSCMPPSRRPRAATPARRTASCSERCQ